MANERFVALYCITAGRKRISLPQICRIEDALTRTEINEAAHDIRFAARAGETRSFALETVVTELSMTKSLILGVLRLPNGISAKRKSSSGSKPAQKSTLE